jgi:glycosyltransferase involved in cell wall biosynthesis
MHLVIVSRRFPPQIGGAETALGRLADGMARRGHRVTVLREARHRDAADRLVDAWRDSAPRKIAEAGVRVVPLRTSFMRFWGTLRWMRALRVALNGLAASCDVFYVSMLKESAYVAVDVGRRRRVPVVLRPSGTGATGDVAWQQRSLHGRLVRRRCQNADALVAVSPQMHDELVGVGYAEQKVRLIPGGVPVSEVAYDPAATQEFRGRLALGECDGPLAVYVGRFSAEKGLADLIAAWKRVVAREPSARLALVGQGPMLVSLERQVRAKGLFSHVRFCGPTDDPEPFLRAADLFVLPSHHEGMSNALMEAMALGLPAVVSDIPGNRAVAADTESALFVPAGRPEPLAGALLDLMADPARRRALGQAARRHAAACFDLQRVLDAHAQLFGQLTQGP